jgi:thymidylate synthase (FAD)
MNLRELSYILKEMLYGRGKCYDEIKNLANQIIGQLKEIFPYLYESILNFEAADYQIPCNFPAANSEEDNRKIRQPVELLNASNDCLENIIQSYFIKNSISANCNSVLRNESLCERIIQEIIHSDRPRELEQISYTFRINGISLAGITHIVRHRMQSIIIPSLLNVNFQKFIIPESIENDADLLSRYKNIFEINSSVYEKLRQSGLAENTKVYFSLSGNIQDIVTTMNAREIMLFFKLRNCNRAQWEIRVISIYMLKILRDRFPMLFNKMGPSCYIDGKCPEGRLTCGKINNIKEEFINL